MKPLPAQVTVSDEADALVPEAETATVAFGGSASEVRRAIDKAARKKGKLREFAGDAPPAPRANVDAFTRGYMNAILFSEADDEGTPLDDDYGVGDFAPETREAIVADCKKFQADNDEAISVGPDRGGASYSAWEQAGHDFWFTRNRHGSGFWDGDWPEPQATQLTDAAHAFGEVNIYTHDGTIYQAGTERRVKQQPANAFQGVEVVSGNEPAPESSEPEPDEHSAGEGWKTESDSLLAEVQHSSGSTFGKSGKKSRTKAEMAKDKFLGMDYKSWPGKIKAGAIKALNNSPFRGESEAARIVNMILSEEEDLDRVMAAAANGDKFERAMRLPRPRSDRSRGRDAPGTCRHCGGEVRQLRCRRCGKPARLGP